MPKQLPKNFFIPNKDYDATEWWWRPRSRDNFGADSIKTVPRDKNTKDAARGVNDPDSKDSNGPARGANPDEKNQYDAPARGVNTADSSATKGTQYEEEGLPPGWVRQWDAKYVFLHISYDRWFDINISLPLAIAHGMYAHFNIGSVH